MIPFSATVRSEWTKLWALRSTKVSFVLAMVLGVGMSALFAWIVGMTHDEWNAAERADIQAAQKRYRDFYADLLTRFDAGAREVSGRAYESLARLGPLPRNDVRDTLTLDLRYDVPFHNGLIVSPIILAQGLRNNFEGKDNTASFGGRGIPTSYTAVLGFSVDAPLLRGFGYTATEAALKAAKLNYEASLDFLAQIASQSVRDTLQAYWRLAAAQERFSLLDRSAGAQGRIHQLSEALVQGDEIPRAELDRVRARRAEALAAVADARGALAIARAVMNARLGMGASLSSAAEGVSSRLHWAHSGGGEASRACDGCGADLPSRNREAANRFCTVCSWRIHRAAGTGDDRKSASRPPVSGQQIPIFAEDPSDEDGKAADRSG